jgi:hypothetical protein
LGGDLSRDWVALKVFGYSIRSLCFLSQAASHHHHQPAQSTIISFTSPHLNSLQSFLILIYHQPHPKIKMKFQTISTIFVVYVAGTNAALPLLIDAYAFSPISIHFTPSFPLSQQS